MPQEIKPSPNDETSIPCPSTNKVRDLTLKFGVKKPSMSSESSFTTKNAKAIKSPLNEKTKSEVVEKKGSTKAKVNNLSSKHVICNYKFLYIYMCI